MALQRATFKIHSFKSDFISSSAVFTHFESNYAKQLHTFD